MVSVTINIGIYLPILFHRVGLIMVFVCSGVLAEIPHFFNREGDIPLATKVSKILILIERLGFVVIVISGIFRLFNFIPHWFIIKAFSAAITLYWVTFHQPVYPAPDYKKSHYIMIGLISLTGTIGMLLHLG